MLHDTSEHSCFLRDVKTTNMECLEYTADTVWLILLYILEDE